MYDNIKVQLIIGNIETATNLKVGVKKWNSMAPVLFMFLMTAFDETLEEECNATGLRK